MINKQSPLSFKVECAACYGMSIWTLGHIARLLTEINKLPPERKSDIEFVAEQFSAHCKRIRCPDCNKLDVLRVQRVVPEV
jgi:ribosomal protein S27E